MSTSFQVAVVPVSTVSQIKALSDPVDDVKLFPVKLTVPVPVKLTLPTVLVKAIPEGDAIVFGVPTAVPRATVIPIPVGATCIESDTPPQSKAPHVDLPQPTLISLEIPTSATVEVNPNPTRSALSFPSLFHKP